MQCSICSQTYTSLKSKQPRILITCGHTFCQECIVSSNHFKDNQVVKIQCFQCKEVTEVTNINQLPVNIAIQKLFKSPKSQSSTPNSLCQTHKKAIEAYCQDDSHLLCIDCIVNGSKTDDSVITHKGHELLNISQTLSSLQKEAESKKIEIEGKYSDWLHESQSQVQYKKQELEEMREGQKKHITEYFRFLRQLIDNQENEQQQILSENYQSFNTKLNSIKERLHYFGILLQDFLQLNERAQGLIEDDQGIQYIKDYTELRSVSDKIDSHFENETTIEAQEILNQDLDECFDRIKCEELMKELRSKIIEEFGKGKTLSRQMTIVTSRQSLRKSYDPILSERKDYKEKLEEHGLQIQMVQNSISRERQYQTSNSLNSKLIQKSTSSRQFISNQKVPSISKANHMGTFSKYLTKSKIDFQSQGFNSFKSKNCSPRGISLNKQSKKGGKGKANITQKSKIEQVNTTVTNSINNKSLNNNKVTLQSSEPSVTLGDEKQRSTLGEDDNKSKVFTPLQTFKKQQRYNPRQLLDHSASMSIISTSSKRQPPYKDILSPLSKKAKQITKQNSKAKNYLNHGKKLLNKSPQQLKKKSAVFSSFEETIQQSHQLSKIEFREKNTQDDIVKNSQDFGQERMTEVQSKQECFDYQMSFKRNPFKDMDIVNTQSNSHNNQFEKCNKIQKAEQLQLSYKVLEDDSQSEDSMFQYPSFNQYNDDYASKSSESSAINTPMNRECRARIREENGKYFIIKDKMFQSEEIEIEGIKIKQILKIKSRNSGSEVKLMVLDENDLIYGIMIDEENLIHKQLIINQEIENELYPTNDSLTLSNKKGKCWTPIESTLFPYTPNCHNLSSISTDMPPINPGDFNNCTVKIPRCLKVSTKISDNDINKVRNKIRINKVFHSKYNPSLESSEGFRYFSGVHNPQRLDYVESPKNLYEFIVKNGSYKRYIKRTFVRPLRTGFNIKDILKKKKELERQREFNEKEEFKREVLGEKVGLKWKDLVESSQEKSHENNPKTLRSVNEQIKQMLKRFEPSVKTSSFSVFRSKIEKIVEEGYSFKQARLNKSAMEKSQAERPLKSPLELQFDREKKERLEREQREKEEGVVDKTNRDDYRFTFLEGIENQNESVKTMRISLAPSLQDSNYHLANNSQNTPSQKTIRNESNDILMAKKTPKAQCKPNTPKKGLNWKEEFQKIKEQKIKERQMSKLVNISPQEDFLKQLQQQVKEIKTQQGKRKTETPSYQHVKSLYHQKALQKAATKRSLFDEVAQVREQYNLSNIDESEESKKNEVNYLQKNIENLRSLRSLFSQEKKSLTGSIKRSCSKKKQQSSSPKKQNSLQNIFNIPTNEQPTNAENPLEKNVMRVVKLNSSSKVKNGSLFQNKRNSQTQQDATFMTALRSKSDLVTKSEDMHLSSKCCVKDLERKNQELQQKKLFKKKLGNLNQIVTELKKYDSDWLKQSEKNRSQRLKEMETTKKHLFQAIDRTYDLQIMNMNNQLEIPLIQEMIETNKEKEKFDQENFLNPAIIKEFKDLNFKSSVKMIKELNQRKIWKPSKFQFTKKSDMMELLKNY